MSNKPNPLSVNRRQFLRTSGLAVAATAVGAASSRPGYTAEANEIKVALVGCGGRGTGAAGQALSTAGPVKLWAVADVFDQKTINTLDLLRPAYSGRIDVPDDRRFVGFDAYKHAIDSLSPGDVVLLTTPPAFRPLHFEYAVQKGMHVFLEKSFAVDAPGIRRVLATGKEADAKGLKVAGGLMSRHSLALEEAVERIHGGIIGEIVTAYAYRMHGPVNLVPRAAGMSEMAYQITNYSCFTWLNGSFLVDWLIHNIDVCCWIMDGWPTSVQGMGGRQVRQEHDQLFDHYMAEFTYENGSRTVAQGRHIANCHDFFGVVVHGTGGSAVLGEGQPKPRIFKGKRQRSEDIVWSYAGPIKDAYQHEHDLLFDAIRSGKPYNEMERCAKSCMAAIMGRMACESGKQVSWEEAFNSQLVLAPSLAGFTMKSDPPVMPRADGSYPIAMPGRTPL